jgi:hypothetical protein
MRLDHFAREMARPLGLRGHQRRTELVASITMGYELRVESPYEASTAVALDIDPRVVKLRSQPFTIRLDLLRVFPTREAALAADPPVPPRAERSDPDDVYVYTPDLEATGSSGAEVAVECKSEDAFRSVEGKVNQWRTALQALGYPLLCITHEQVSRPGLNYNLVCIRDATRALGRDGAQALDPLLRLVEGCQGPLTFGALQPQVPDHVIQLGIAAGVLGCDLKAGVIGPHTELWPAHGDLSHLCILDLGL